MNSLAARLDAIHAALLLGDLGQIGPLSRQLTEDLAAAQGSDWPEDALQAVRAKAQRNARVLDAALRGIRAARRRLAELHEAASGHRTYGRDGNRAAAAPLPTTLRQRI
jgi:hypothetical protein